MYGCTQPHIPCPDELDLRSLAAKTTDSRCHSSCIRFDQRWEQSAPGRCPAEMFFLALRSDSGAVTRGLPVARRTVRNRPTSLGPVATVTRTTKKRMRDS